MKREHPASRLRERLTLQQAVDTPDNLGGYSRNWVDVAELWAEVEALASRSRSVEVFIDGQLQTRTLYRIRIRSRNDITTAMRLIYRTQPLAIRSVSEIGARREMLEILVEAGIETI